jgi:NADPH2:quinone reductase
MTMKAVLMTSVGGPEVLDLHDVPIPQIKHDTDMLVRLYAAGINPVDTKLRARGTYYPDRLPCILGCDGAGVVESVGSAVTRFKAGDAVYFCHGGIGSHPGNYAQYAVVDERFVARKPNSLDFAQAAAAPLVLITAWESLFQRTQVQPGDHILIHAGAGGVGHMAIQLACLHGAQVATTVSTADKAHFVEELGASRAILYRKENFVTTSLQWTQNRGVDMALDTVGGDTFINSLSAVKIYGDLVTLLEPPAGCDWKTARIRNLRVGFELMLTPMYRHLVGALQQQADILRRGAELFDAGKLKIHIHSSFPLAEAAAAHRLMLQESIKGKVVLTID